MEISAQKVISNHVSWSVAAGLLPVPIVDFGLVTALQMDMIKRLCEVYNIPYQHSEAKTRVIAVMGGMTPRLMSSLIKVIPFIGSVTGAVAMPLLSGASTFAVGQVLAKHFKEGGTLENFEISKFTDYYRQMQVQGKELAQLLAEQMKAIEDTTSFNDIERLKEQGFITNEEYESIKKRWNEKRKITLKIN